MIRNDGSQGDSYGTGRFAEVGDLSKVSSHAYAALVVERMPADLRTHPTEWENQTLEHFLGALAGVLDGLPGLYASRGEQFPQAATWKILAEVLVSASVGGLAAVGTLGRRTGPALP